MQPVHGPLLPDMGGPHHEPCLAVRGDSEYHAHRAPPRSVRSTGELFRAGHETQAQGGDEKGCRRLLPVTWSGWLIFSAKPRNWLPASISMWRIYSVETDGSRRMATARVSLGPYLPRSNPSLLSCHRTLQNSHLNDKPVPLEELDRCPARYGKKGTAPGQSA